MHAVKHLVFLFSFVRMRESIKQKRMNIVMACQCSLSFLSG